MGSEEHAATLATGGRDTTGNPGTDRYVLTFEAIDATRVGGVGGKAAHLAELARIEGVHVPPGFCVTTDAFRRSLARAPSVDGLLDRLAGLTVADGAAIDALSAELRAAVEAVAIPEEVADAITVALADLGGDAAYAVRSSATAEDSPTASFAGQHDSFLNVIGADAVLAHVRRCWASLFTARAVAYRLREGVDRDVAMAVVVQQMVRPRAAGVLFTADPVTSDRRVTAVEASFGLGEAVVSGLVNPDIYRVRDGAIVERVIAAKRLAIEVSPAGGTQRRPIPADRRERPALTDAEVLRLAEIGRRVEASFGGPQDVEWCLLDEDVALVQSRPITTLFPIPAADDAENHVYVSVGHQQMMTDAMKPLGLSVFQLTALPRMHEAGGRLFVDVTARLASPASREGLLETMGRGDPLLGDALRTLLARGDFPLPAADDAADPPPVPGAAPLIDADPALVETLVRRGEASLAAAGRTLRATSGPALFDAILADLAELKRLIFQTESMQPITTAVLAAWWLNDRLEAWLGERNAADVLTQSVPHNITSEMGLALLDVADAIRPHPEVVAFLEQTKDDNFLDALDRLDGGREARDAIGAYLERYGMRCVGEIDLTRPRWSERPTALLPALVGNIRHFAAGAGPRRFEEGRRAAQAEEHELLARLRALPDGEAKAQEAKRMIDRVRTFSGYREYPKYMIISRYFLYKQRLLAEAERLVAAGVLRTREDVFFLTFHEFADVVRTHAVDAGLLAERERAFRSYAALTPPRVLTSEGEAVVGAYRRAGLPPGALAGLAVSGGTVEGRARVVLDMAEAAFAPGDILVTTHTDPSWSPVFVAVAGLVTEVGGLMTHGAVIAREYGLPAVVGVEDATRRIADGQRIRVDGTDGHVEILG